MVGMPPSVGFVTKLYLIIACMEAGQFIFVVAIFASTLLIVYYFWRVIEYMYIRTGDKDDKEVEVDEVPVSMLIPILILGVLCFIIGIVWLIDIPLPMMDAVNSLFGLGGMS